MACHGGDAEGEFKEIPYGPYPNPNPNPNPNPIRQEIPIGADGYVRLPQWTEYMTALKRDKGQAYLQHTLDHLLKNLAVNQPGTAASQVMEMLSDNPEGTISKEVLVAAHGGNEA